MLTFDAPDPREGERLASDIEQVTGHPADVVLVGGSWHIDTEAAEDDVRAIVDAHDGTPPPDPDSELDAGLAEIAARDDVPDWGHALLANLRGQGGFAGRAAGRRPE